MLVCRLTMLLPSCTIFHEWESEGRQSKKNENKLRLFGCFVAWGPPMKNTMINHNEPE